MTKTLGEAHTPTPWHWASVCDWTLGGINISKEDAAFIVLAVNAHDSLVAALRQIVEYDAKVGDSEDGPNTTIHYGPCARIARIALSHLAREAHQKSFAPDQKDDER